MTELGDRATAASRLNLAQSFNGLGCICGPLLGGLLLFGDGDGDVSHTHISLPYLIMGVVVLVVAFVFTRVNLPEIQHHESDAAGSDRPEGGLFSHRLFLFGLLALFCYEIAEISINSFFINYVTDDGWLDARDASMILSFGGLGLFMCGRFAGSWVMQYVRAERALLCCAVGAVVAVGLVLASLGMVSRVSLLLVYVCEAIMFPTIFAIALKGLGDHTKRASSFLMMSPIGGAVGPLLMGSVADATSMTFSFIVPFLAFVVVMIYAAFADRKERKFGK
jgi:FHS family L-fucose permease-like MFS transporter